VYTKIKTHFRYRRAKSQTSFSHQFQPGRTHQPPSDILHGVGVQETFPQARAVSSTLSRENVVAQLKHQRWHSNTIARV
jgi:hypothetical protein